MITNYRKVVIKKDYYNNQRNISIEYKLIKMKNINPNNSQQNNQLGEAVPQVSFDSDNFYLRIDGKIVDYQQFTLTTKGLQIQNTQASDGGNLKIMVDLAASIQFDTKLNEAKYCMELAKCIERSSNSYFHRSQKYNRASGSQQQTKFDKLEICELILKKIPLKPRCFQSVFKHIPIRRIKFLFENDSFFIEVSKFLFHLIFKVNINQKNLTQSPVHKYEQEYTSYENSQDEKINEQKIRIRTTKKQSFNKGRMSHFELKVIDVFKRTFQPIKIHKLCFERVNILLQIFTQETRLSNYLYELNRQLINLELTNYIEKTFKTKYCECEGSQDSKQKIMQCLVDLIRIIRTVNSSIGKSSVAYQILRQKLVGSEVLQEWIQQNLAQLSQVPKISNKFIQLIACFSEFSCSFVSNIYASHQSTFNKLLKSQIQWVYLTLILQFQQQHQTILNRQYAQIILDSLLIILQATIKQTISPVNIGRSICKFLCNTATNLRQKDIQILTYSCCVNQHQRPYILKYLFAYFRKYIKSIKAQLKGSKRLSVPIMKKNKHKMAQIMQSIGKISEIEQIELVVDEQLMRDIQMIVWSGDGRDGEIGRQKENWISGVYLWMRKKVRVEKRGRQKEQTEDSLKND